MFAVVRGFGWLVCSFPIAFSFCGRKYMNLVGTCTYCKCRVTFCAGLLQCRLVDLGISCTVAVFCVVASSGVPGLLAQLAALPCGCCYSRRFSGHSERGSVMGAVCRGVVGGVRPLWLPGGVCCVVVAGQR